MRRPVQVRVGDRRDDDRLLLHPRHRLLALGRVRRADRLDPVPIGLSDLAGRVEVFAGAVRDHRRKRGVGYLARRRTVDVVPDRPREIRPLKRHTVRARLGLGELRRQRTEVRGHALGDIRRQRERILHRLARRARPVQELVPVVRHGRQRDLASERIRRRARSTLAPYGEREKHPLNAPPNRPAPNPARGDLSRMRQSGLPDPLPACA